MFAWGRKPEPAALQPFDAGFRGAWSWRQPSWHRSHWELRAGEALVGTLDGSGLLGAPVTARVGDQAWRLRSRWLLRLTATLANAAEPLATFQGGWFGSGTLTLEGGTVLHWRREDFWRHHYVLETADRLPWVHFRTRRRFMRYEGDVTIEDVARRSPALPLFLALGWQLVLHSLRSSGRHGAH